MGVASALALEPTLTRRIGRVEIDGVGGRRYDFIVAIGRRIWHAVGKRRELVHAVRVVANLVTSVASLWRIGPRVSLTSTQPSSLSLRL